MAKQTFTTGQVLTAAQVNSLQSNDFNQTVSVKTASYTLVGEDKGTRIEFNTSGSVTCTVNTGLFDAGDTLIIQNRGAGVVTVTAGTATVNTSATLALSQYDAGTLYFVSASAAIFFNTDAGGGGSPLTTKGDLYGFSTVDARIPIGANNTVLTADSSETLGLKWAAAGSASFVGVGLNKTSDQSISNDTSTAITYTGEDFDTDGFHSTVTNTSRITIPSGKGGYYYIYAFLSFQDNATGSRAIHINKNGSRIATFTRVQTVTETGATTTIGGTMVFNLAATDYIEVLGFQKSGGSLNVLGSASPDDWRSRFGAYLIGA